MLFHENDTIHDTVLCYPLGRSKKWWRCQQETLVEREACPCSKFHIQVYGPWSPCLLPELHQPVGYPFTKKGSHLVQRITQAWRRHGEGKECGQGWRYRALACLDHHERLVNPTLCNTSGETLPGIQKCTMCTIVHYRKEKTLTKMFYSRITY